MRLFDPRTLRAFRRSNLCLAERGIDRWIGYYNSARPHSLFGGRTPDELYAIEPTTEKPEKLAA